MLLTVPDFFQTAREKNGFHQRGAEIDFAAGRIGKGEPVRMLARHLDEIALERLHPRAAELPGVDLQFLHRLTHGKGRGGRRQRRAETHGDGMRNVRGEQMHKLAAPVTRRPAEHAVERDGDDGRVHVFHDMLDAAPERQELADARDLPLGKNADDLAIADGVAGFLQRV
jgi:hypothetical protein